MSYYPKQYPVLEKTEWRFDVKEHFKRGSFECTIPADTGPQVTPGKRHGVYVTEIIDGGQAVAWKEIAWEADLPLGSTVSMRTRFGADEQECAGGRWSARYTVSPAKISLSGSRECHVVVAAARFIQVRAEMAVGTGGTPTLRKLGLTAGLVPPACVGPMNRGIIADGSPAFHWTRVEGAASYSFELSCTPDFSGEVFRENGIRDNAFVCSKQVPEGTYCWRVRAFDGTGQPTDYSPTRQFSVGPRPRADRTRLKHPYLFFSAEDIPGIRKRLLSVHSETWHGILERADEALAAQLWDEKDVLLAPGQHGDFHGLSRQVARGQLEPLAFAYLFTGEEKYAAKAREVMLHLVGFSRWTGAPFGDPKFCYPAWQAALETAAMCKGVGTAYDWLRDYLTEDDAAAVRAGLLRLGVLPIVESWADPKTICHVPRHQLPAGNWWSVCNSGAGIAALAMLGEVQDAQRWVEMTADAVRAYLCYPGGDTWNVDTKAGSGGQYLLSTRPNWGEDGGYIESVGYLNYGLVNAMYFVEALKRVAGEDLAPHINAKLIDHPYYFTAKGHDGELRAVNFNDSGQANLSDDLYALLARHLRCGRCKYLLDSGYPVLKSIHAVLAADDDVEARSPDPERRNVLLKDIGWSVFRSGWDPDASLMAAKFTHGRGHGDIGQFVIHHKGLPFVVDPGVVAYSDPIYRTFLATSHAHNLVLVDDQTQMRVDGEVLGYAQAPGIGLVEADLTGAYQDLIDSWIRTLVYLEPDCFVVIDRLSSDREHTYSWEIHPSGKLAIQPGLGAAIYQDNDEMQVRLVSPSSWRTVTKQGYIGAAPAEYLSFAPDKPCEQVCFAAVFAGTKRGRNIGVERQEKGVSLAIKVITPEASHVILTRPRKGGKVSGWEVTADASTCAVTHPKGDSERECKWVIAGRGPLREKEKELAAISATDDLCRAGVCRPTVP